LSRRTVLFLQVLMLAACLPAVLVAQDNTDIGSVQGKIYDDEGEPLIGMTVFIQELKKGTSTDHKGNFIIDNLSPGIYSLVISGIGFKEYSQPIEIEKGQRTYLELVMQSEELQMGEIIVQAKSTAEEIRETGFTVDVIQTESLKSFSTDINQVLESAPGVHLREQGGLGSSFNLSLNGLSGNQVRYFIDGVPMENFGSALTLNNFPVNLIDNIEVYKGVVPIWLGADALGGAINITTAYRQKSFFDVSHSSGSFNTHRSSLNGQFVDQDKGYVVRLLSFFNYSDNDYEMVDVPVYDLELGNRVATINTDRFHNEYLSGMGRAEVGLINKRFADYLSLNVTYAENKKNFQHPDNSINTVFGQFHTRNETRLISSQYEKEIGNLSLNGYLLGGKIEQSVVDTSSLKYNWAGDSIRRGDDLTKGELFERRSLTVLTDKVFRSNVSAIYKLDSNHLLSLNISQNFLNRTGQDQVNEFNRSFESPNYIHKNLVGLAYTYKTDSENLEASVFGKGYWYSGKIITLDFEDNEIITEPEFTNTGYGGFATWRLNNQIQFKTSFEKTFRVPESFEILGDGIYILPNPNLEPEKSHNANAGIRYTNRVSPFYIKGEANYFFRSSNDFIRFNPIGPFGTYQNLQNVRTTGIEASAGVEYKELVTFSGNLTWQNLRDWTQFDEGLPNTNYKSRVPNIPYLFGSARLGINPFKNLIENNLRFYWNTKYVHDFFLTWENLGDADSKNMIPSQLIHDLQVEYSLNDEEITVSLAVNNITDELVYDNFNIQKPGRAAYVKLGYFFN